MGKAPTEMLPDNMIVLSRTGCEQFCPDRKNSFGTAKIYAEGTGILPAFILPILLYLPATEKASCKALAKQLANALSVR